MSHTFEVFRGQQYRAQVVFLDERLDMGRDGGPIKAHHEQLALCDRLLARTTASALTCAP